MRNRFLIPAVIGFAALAPSCHRWSVALPALSPVTVGDTTGLVERGEYVVRNAAACGHCHAADAKGDPDGPLSGGMEFKDWRIGTARASNITPDSATGIGGWSDAELVRALRNGERKDGRLLAPVMPYEWFHQMSDRDALAVSRYLRSRPAVRNEVGFPAHSSDRVNPGGDSLHPFMPWREVRRMSDDDLRAIYRYLRTLPAISNAIP